MTWNSLNESAKQNANARPRRVANRRLRSFGALCGAFACCAWFVWPGKSESLSRVVKAQPSATNRVLGAPTSIAAGSHPAPAPRLTPFCGLPALWFKDVSAQRRVALRLYDSAGSLDEQAAVLVDDLCADRRRKGETITRRIERRLIQVLARSAYHFGKYEIEIVSCYRQPQRRREGLHAQGRAIDYRIVDVEASALASYLRKTARLGVGVYTHRKTQYVHLDVRDTSYHWLDASPPGRRWRGQSIGSRELVALDAAYRPTDDWPDGFVPLAQASEVASSCSSLR